MNYRWAPRYQLLGWGLVGRTIVSATSWLEGLKFQVINYFDSLSGATAVSIIVRHTDAFGKYVFFGMCVQISSLNLFCGMLPFGRKWKLISMWVGKPEGKRPLGRPRCRWEDNIKMDLQEVGGGCEDWMELAQDRDRWRALVSTVMNLRVPKMWGISWLAAELVSFSRRTLLHGVSKYVSTDNAQNVKIAVLRTQSGLKWCNLHPRIAPPSVRYLKLSQWCCWGYKSPGMLRLLGECFQTFWRIIVDFMDCLTLTMMAV